MFSVPGSFLVMIFFTFGNEENSGEDDGHEFGDDDGDPYAVNLPDHGQQKDSGDRTHKCDAQSGEDHKKRHNQVNRSKGSLSCKIGYKESIHDTIDRSIDHHADRRQGKPDQTAVGKVIR